MARKGWDQLKADYRNRLERNGVTRADYERGASLKAGRGHERTPERPSLSNPQKFPEYHRERQRLVNAVNHKKQQIFGSSPKWNPNKAKANIIKYSPSMALLRWAENASEDEWLDAIRESSEVYSFLGYH